VQEKVITMSTAPMDVEVPTVRGLVVRSKWMHRLLTFLMVFGPGLIVMVADNDAGAVSTYVQAGAQYGTRLLWVLLLLWPTTYFIQEMEHRRVQGAGDYRLQRQRERAAQVIGPFFRRYRRLQLAQIL